MRDQHPGAIRPSSRTTVLSTRHRPSSEAARPPRGIRHHPLALLLPVVAALAVAWTLDRALPQAYTARALLVIDGDDAAVGFVLEPEIVAGPRFRDAIVPGLPPAPAAGPWAEPWRVLAAPAVAMLADAAPEPLRALAGAPIDRVAASLRDGGRGLELAATAAGAVRAEALRDAAAARLLADRLARRRAALDARVDALDRAMAEVTARRDAAAAQLDRAEPDALAAAEARATSLEADLAAARLALTRAERDLEEIRVAARTPRDEARLLAQPRAGDLARAIAERDATARRRLELDAIYGERHPLLLAATEELALRQAAVDAAAADLVAGVEREVADRRGVVAALGEELEVALGEVARRRDALALRDDLARSLATDSARLAELATARAIAQRDRLALLPDARVVATSDAVPLDRRPLRTGLYAAASGLGLGVGLGVAGWRARALPRRFRTVAHLEATVGLPVLAGLPPLPRRLDRLPHSRLADSVERLWLHLESAPIPARTLAVLGVDPGVDAARLAAALALVGTAQGRSVLLIDAGAPSLPLHRLLRLRGGPGYGEVLAASRAWTDVVEPWSERGPWLLARGRAAPGATPGAALDVLLQSVARRFDRVIIAAPPLAGAPGLRVARAAGTALVAVRANASRRLAVSDGLNALQRVGGDLVGLVLTDCRTRA